MQLRSYQRDAVNACYAHLRQHDDNPCIVLPTGAGKTPVMAQIVRDAVTGWKGRVMILAHRKELLEQTRGAVQRMAPEVDVGIYSAGLNSREQTQPCIVAGIQSVYQRATEFEPFNLVMVDEAHLIPKSGDGMYKTFLKEAALVNPKVRVIGLTATPYRTGSGNLCTPKGILNRVCYEIGVKELIKLEFLCPVISKVGDEASIADTSKVGKVAGEFNLGELEACFSDADLIEKTCEDLVRRSDGRRKILVFCCGVDHAEKVSLELARITGERVGFLTGETPADERRGIIKGFRDAALRWLVNINVLTEGFDAPNVDCVALLRATCSPGLYYQMVGRGLRLADDKTNCLVLDYGENILRHGPIDDVKRVKKGKGGGEAPVKFCKECEIALPLSARICPECGYEFPDPGPRHETQAEERYGVLSGEVRYERWPVMHVCYDDHKKRGADDSHPRTLRVEYVCGMGARVSEWVCVEHPIGGFPRNKAEKWWKDRCWTDVDCPTSAKEAARLAPDCLLEPAAVDVKIVFGKKFPEISGYEFPATTHDWKDEIPKEEIPF